VDPAHKVTSTDAATMRDSTHWAQTDAQTIMNATEEDDALVQAGAAVTVAAETTFSATAICQTRKQLMLYFVCLKLNVKIELSRIVQFLK